MKKMSYVCANFHLSKIKGRELQELNTIVSKLKEIIYIFSHLTKAKFVFYNQLNIECKKIILTFYTIGEIPFIFFVT